MLEALRWPLRRRERAAEAEPEAAGTTARFGGDDGDEPVLIGVVSGPVAAEMAKDALAEAGIPAYVKANSAGSVYGLSVGSFGSAEVWALPAVAEQARDVLVGIGLLTASGEAAAPDGLPLEEEGEEGPPAEQE